MIDFEEKDTEHSEEEGKFLVIIMKNDGCEKIEWKSQCNNEVFCKLGIKR